MADKSLHTILEEDREVILQEMCSNLGANVSASYQNFLLNTQDGKRRLSIFLDMALEAIKSSPESFYQDQKKVGYYRAVQGYSLGDVTTVPLSFVAASARSLQREYDSASAIPDHLVKELIEANKIILNSMRLVAQSYITTREERIASEINNIKLLYHFTKNIMSIFNFDDISIFVSSELKKVFQADIVITALSRHGRLDCITDNCKDNFIKDVMPLMKKSWSESKSFFVAEEGEVFHQVDIYTLKKVIVVPIKGPESNHGSVMLASLDRGLNFTEKEMAFLEQFLLITTIVIQNSLLFEKLQLSSQRMSLLTRQTLRIREEEKKRIAENIHDTLTQTLTGISYKLQYCLEVCEPQAASLSRQLSELIPTVQEAINQSRELIASLHPDIIDNIGLVSALERLANNFVQHHHIEVGLDLAPHLELPAHITIPVYRIVQEAMANVAKHSQANAVHISLKRLGDNVSLQIFDDGKGFDLASSHERLPFERKFGLFYIQQRVESMEGKFKIKSAPNEGCSISVVLPLMNQTGE